MQRFKYIFTVTLSFFLFSTTLPVLANTEPNIKPLQNKQVYSGDKVRVRANVSDADGDSLAFYWTQESGTNLQFRGVNTDTLTFTAPRVDQSTEYIFKLTVSDGQSNSEASVKVLVEPPHASVPVADAGLAQNVFEQELVTLDASPSADEDSLALTFFWTQTAGPQVQFSPTQAKTTFFAPQVITTTLLTFQVEVSDGDQTSTDTVDITVRPRAKFAEPLAPLELSTPITARNDSSMESKVAAQVPVVLFIDAPTTALAGDTVQLKSSVQQPGVTYFWRVANYPLLVEDSYAQVTSLQIPSDFSIGKEIIVELTIYTSQEAIKKQHTIVIVGGSTPLASTISPVTNTVISIATESPQATATPAIEPIKQTITPLSTSTTIKPNLPVSSQLATDTSVNASLLTSDSNFTIKSVITAILIATGVFCIIYALSTRRKTGLSDVTIYDQRK